VILWRCFAWSPRARADEQDGPLWFPRLFQGDGRHDNPDAYGCLYLADREASCAVEQLARFRTQRLQPARSHSDAELTVAALGPRGRDPVFRAALEHAALLVES